MATFPVYKQLGTPEASLPWIEFCIVFKLIIYVVETYLHYRQYNKLCETSPPQILISTIRKVEAQQKEAKASESAFAGEDENEHEPLINPEAVNAEDARKSERSLTEQILAKFTKSQDYGRAKSEFSFVVGLFNECLGLGLLLAGSGPYFWNASRDLLMYLGISQGPISCTLVFLLIQHIISLPIGILTGLYSQFVIEEKFGFNKQTLKLYFMDLLKQQALTIVIGAPLISIFLKIVEWGGPHFYIYVWAFLLFFGLFMMSVYPAYIQPLFNEVKPLPEGRLRTKIEALAGRLDYPLKKLFVIDGSKRSNHSNAYMYGLWKNKRIVLFDTLIAQASESEIVAILAHELGHWQKNHTVQGLLLSQIISFAIFFSYGQVKENGDMFASFGFKADESVGFPIIIGLSLFLESCWTPIDSVLSRLMTLNVRKNEFQADAFAVELGYSGTLQTGLVKLQIENLSNMNPDPWYSAYHYSHPPLAERLDAIQNEEGNLGAGKKKKNQ